MSGGHMDKRWGVLGNARRLGKICLGARRGVGAFWAVAMLAAAPALGGALDSAAGEEPGAAAPVALRLTLTEAVLMALEDNPLLRIERINPAVRGTYTREERAAFDPVLAGTLTRDGVDTDTHTALASVAATNLDKQAATWHGKVGVEQYLPTGTRVGLAAERTDGRADLTSSAIGDYDERRDATHYGLTLTQSLLRGFGATANLARLRQARLDVRISEYELHGVAESLVARVETAGWDCVLAGRRLEIYAESLRLAERQRDEVRERILVGHLADIELAAAEAEVAQRRESLINANSLRARRQLEFVRLIGPGRLPDGWTQHVELADTPFVPDEPPAPVGEHVQSALANRPELNEARLRIARGDLEVARTRNGLLPRLDFFITLGRTDYADSFSAAARDVDADETYVKAGLRLEYPPLARAERAGYARAKLQREQAALALRNLEDLVQLEVRSALLEVCRTGEQIEATQFTRRHREESWRAETEKFRVGKSTTILVAQAQRDLVASRIAEVESVINHLKARLELFRLDGSLLERRGIASDGGT